MAKDVKFEVPAEMRELAEKSVALRPSRPLTGLLPPRSIAVGTAETQVKTMQTGAKQAGELA